MLRMISFSLFVQPEQFQRYRSSLYSHISSPTTWCPKETQRLNHETEFSDNRLTCVGGSDALNTASQNEDGLAHATASHYGDAAACSVSIADDCARMSNTEDANRVPTSRTTSIQCGHDGHRPMKSTNCTDDADVASASAGVALSSSKEGDHPPRRPHHVCGVAQHANTRLCADTVGSDPMRID